MKRALTAVAAACLLAACGTAHNQSATGSHHPPGWGKPAPQGVQHTFALTPTAVQWDTITLSTIPANPFATAGYTSGFWPTYLPLRRAYPKAHTISIAINASNHADCLDVEPGDASPSQAAGWVKADIKAGFKKPCVYSSYWEFVNQVRPDLAAAGISRSSIFEWDADYTYTAHIDAGFDATQWTDRALGRNLDESTVTLAFLSIAQPPYRPARPLPVCFTHRLSRSACSAVKAKIAAAVRAQASSQRALTAVESVLTADRCVTPYRRGVCRHSGRRASLFTGRVRYFTARARTLQAAS